MGILVTWYLVCYIDVQLFTTITVDEPAPGLKTIFSFIVPDQRSGKVKAFFNCLPCQLSSYSHSCIRMSCYIMFWSMFDMEVHVGLYSCTLICSISRTWLFIAVLWSTFWWLWWQVELQYQHEYAGISTSIGLTANPLVNFSGVIGNNSVSLGTDLSFDTATGNFTKFNAGLSYSHTDLIAALTLWVILSSRSNFFFIYYIVKYSH